MILKLTSFVAGLWTLIQSFVFDSTNLPSIYMGTLGIALDNALNLIDRGNEFF